LIFSLPHFVTGPYQYHSFGLLPPLCHKERDLDECTFHQKYEEDESHLRHFVYLFLLSQAFSALGGCIIYTVGLSFLHESVNPSESPVYIGIFYGVGGIGPAVGYLLGGHFLDTFVDVDKADAMATFELHGEGRLTTSDPRWCGAWWIGFALAMIIALVLALPLAAFPRKLRKRNAINAAEDVGVFSEPPCSRDVSRYVITPDQTIPLQRPSTTGNQSRTASNDRTTSNDKTTSTPKLNKTESKRNPHSSTTTTPSPPNNAASTSRTSTRASESSVFNGGANY